MATSVLTCCFHAVAGGIRGAVATVEDPPNKACAVEVAVDVEVGASAADSSVLAGVGAGADGVELALVAVASGLILVCRAFLGLGGLSVPLEGGSGAVALRRGMLRATRG